MKAAPQAEQSDIVASASSVVVSIEVTQPIGDDDRSRQDSGRIADIQDHRRLSCLLFHV